MLSTRMAAMMQQLMPGLAATSQTSHDSDDIIDLSSAENVLLRPEVTEVLKTGIRDEIPDYVFTLPTSFGGDLKTRHALANFFNNYFRPVQTVSHEDIVLTPGAGTCIEALIHSICDEGDSVLMPTPCWFGFKPYISGRPKVNIVFAAQDNNGLLASLKLAFDSAPDPSRIKALILCNPQNPVSQCYPEDGLRQGLQFCQEHNLHFISDELYALANIKAEVSGQPKFVSALSMSAMPSATTHVVWSASKLFGLSGLRIGCVVTQANPSIRAAVSLLTYAGTSSLSATGLTTLLTSPQLPSLLDLNSQRLSASYLIFSRCFKALEIEFMPATDGLFIFARLGKNVKSVEEDATLMGRLKKEGLAVSPGHFYSETGNELGWARINIAVTEDLAKEAVTRFERFYLAI